jgi:hypothetical protein
VGSVTINSPGVWSITGTGRATLTADLINAGGLDVDVGSTDGGGNLTITVTLANSKTVQVGSRFLNAGPASTLSLGALTNAYPGGSSSPPWELAFIAILCYLCQPIT